MTPDEVSADWAGRADGDLAERLQRLADTRTADRRPWPGVHVAIRRSRRRRLAGLSGVTALSLALAGAAYTGLLDHPSHARLNAPAARVRLEGLAQLRTAGYGGPTGGSLAGDKTYLAQVQRRVQDVTRHLSPGVGRADLDRPEEVLIPWASEIGGARYVLAVYPAQDQQAGPAGQPAFGEAVLSGPIGAEAGALQVVSSTSWLDVDPTKITGYTKVFVPTAGADPASAALVVVTGPTVTGVRVATARHFSPAGTASTDWQPLPRAGAATWVGELSTDELYLADIEVDGADAGFEDGEPPFPGVERMASVAPVGTDQPALDCASAAQRQLGASVRESPVLGLTGVTSPDKTLAVSVFQSPDGPYLVTFCRGTTGRFATPPGGGSSTGTVVPHARGTGDTAGLMVAVLSDAFEKDAVYLVLAPAGANTVGIGDRTVPVHNRLALLPRQEANPYTPPATIVARDANGNAIGQVKALAGQ